MCASRCASMRVIRRSIARTIRIVRAAHSSSRTGGSSVSSTSTSAVGSNSGQGRWSSSGRFPCLLVRRVVPAFVMRRSPVALFCDGLRRAGWTRPNAPSRGGRAMRLAVFTTRKRVPRLRSRARAAPSVAGSTATRGVAGGPTTAASCRSPRRPSCVRIRRPGRRRTATCPCGLVARFITSAFSSNPIDAIDVRFFVRVGMVTCCHMWHQERKRFGGCNRKISGPVTPSHGTLTRVRSPITLAAPHATRNYTIQIRRKRDWPRVDVTDQPRGPCPHADTHHARRRHPNHPPHRSLIDPNGVRLAAALKTRREELTT